MKHNLKITLVILLMFLVTQFIGLYVVDSYAKKTVVDGEIVNVSGKTLPYGLEFPLEEQKVGYTEKFFSLLISFTFAILILFVLTKYKAKFILKAWFFLVTILALGISFTSILPEMKYLSLIGILLAIPLAIGKVYKRNFLSHNLSELLVYPGIAAVFVPLLSLITMIILLIVISLYDMWAVWKSGIMQKMAKYQMNELKIFSGFYLPYASKKMKAKIKKLKETGKDLTKANIKIHVAILGGGDVVFPIMTSGVILKTWGLLPAILVIFGALVGLGGLLIFSKKKKFYPAMPFITGGMFLGMLIGWLLIS